MLLIVSDIVAMVFWIAAVLHSQPVIFASGGMAGNGGIWIPPIISSMPAGLDAYAFASCLASMTMRRVFMLSMAA